MKADKEFAGHIEILEGLGFVIDVQYTSTNEDGSTERTALMVRKETKDMAIVKVTGDKDGNKTSRSVIIEDIYFLLGMAKEAQRYITSKWVALTDESEEVQKKGA